MCSSAAFLSRKPGFEKAFEFVSAIAAGKVQILTSGKIIAYLVPKRYNSAYEKY